MSLPLRNAGPREDAVASQERRFTEKGRATRARIVEVAAQQMFDHGVSGTSVEDVRRAALVSGSQIAHYFADKKSLISAVVEYQADALCDLATAPEVGPLDSWESLQRWTQLTVARLEEHEARGGCGLGSLAGELAEADDEIRGQINAAYVRWGAVITGGLRSMHQRGDLRPDADPERLAIVLMAANQGGALLSKASRTSAPLRTALDSALGFLRNFAPS